ncbi:hypothetical protein J5500_04655 [Candidatus Saccharibacteria bacterium]|nr:hypothetical protein [Candidatus Saccharibacteria bacterium]
MDNNGLRSASNKTVTIGGKKLPLWKVFLYGTIGFFSFDALLGIFLILFGSLIKDYEFIGKLASTTSILGLFCLLTMNNILRRESKDKAVKISATAAMVMNIFWIIPWLLIVWSCFDGLKAGCVYPEYPSYARYGTIEYENARNAYEQDYRDYRKCLEPFENAQKISWKIIGDSIILAVFLTLLANYLSFKSRTTAIAAIKTTALVCGAILAILGIAEISFEGFKLDEMTAKLMGIIGIVFAFSVITTPILVRGQKKKSGKNEMIEDENANEIAPKEPLSQVVNEAELRKRIELELRTQIEAELREKIEKEVRAEIEAEQAKEENK